MPYRTNPLPLSIGRNIFGLECETCGRTSRIVTEIVIDAPHRRPRVIGTVQHCAWCLRHEGDAPATGAAERDAERRAGLLAAIDDPKWLSYAVGGVIRGG